MAEQKLFLPEETLDQRRDRLLHYAIERNAVEKRSAAKKEEFSDYMDIVWGLYHLEVEYADKSDSLSELRLLNANFWGKYKDDKPKDGVDPDEIFKYVGSEDAKISDFYKYVQENRNAIRDDLIKYMQPRAKRKWVQPLLTISKWTAGATIVLTLSNYSSSVFGSFFEAWREIPTSEGRQKSFQAVPIPYNPWKDTSIGVRQKGFRDIAVGEDHVIADYDNHGRWIVADVHHFLSNYETALAQAQKSGDARLIWLNLYSIYYLKNDYPEFFNHSFGFAANQKIDVLFGIYDSNGMVLKALKNDDFEAAYEAKFGPLQTSDQK